jgi:hypothetical protein
MAAGITTKFISGAETISITLWPIEVDTKFTTTAGWSPEVSMESTSPSLFAVVPVLPIETDVVWTIGDSLTNNSEGGFRVLAQANSGDVPLFTGGRTVVRQVGVSGDQWTDISPLPNAKAEYVIKRSINTFTQGATPFDKIDKEGSANFELTYVPFGEAIWSDYTHDSKTPWIIRNGVNDLAQTDATDFSSPANWPSTKNGNGAVRFKPTDTVGDTPDVPSISDPSAFKISGILNSTENADSTNHTDIVVTTAGYTGDGAVYYAIAASEPSYSVYTKKGDYSAATHDITIDGTYKKSPTNDKIYLLLYKDGKIATFTIRTTGDTGYETVWGPDPIP